MTKFMSATLLVRALTAVVLINTINANLRGRLPDAAKMSSLFKDEAKESLTFKERPFVKSFDMVINNPKNKKIRKLTKVDMEKVIKKKIHQLKPDLDEQKELFSDSEDDEQTSIIEFSPFPESNVRDKNSPRPEKVKDAINQYKKLRREIGNVLEKESVSAHTKHIVTRTLDRLISQMISSQCNLRNDVSNVPTKRAQGSFLKMDKVEMLQSWTKKWQDLIKQYTVGTEDADTTGAGYKEMFLFLIRLREFFFQIHDELNMLNDRFMVKCKLTEKKPNKKSEESKDLRARNDNFEDKCKYVKICSDELRAFMMDFYVNVKEMVEIVFKNYREMYKRDVTTDTSIEMRSFINMLNIIDNNVIGKIDRSFRKATIKLDLKQFNSTKDRLNVLKKFIEITVDNVEKISKEVLAEHLKPLESKLRSTVTQDLLTSIGIELNNFKKEKIDKICLLFQTCNGNSTRRRSNSKDKFSSGSNNIKVKLKIGFEDLESLRKSLKKRTNVFGGKRHQRSNHKQHFDFRKYAHIKVTRTRHTTLDQKIYTKTITKSTPTTTTTTTMTTTTTPKPQSPCTTANVAKETTYTYADHLKERLGKIKTSDVMHFIKKIKEEDKTADPQNTGDNILSFFDL